MSLIDLTFILLISLFTIKALSMFTQEEKQEAARVASAQVRPSTVARTSVVYSSRKTPIKKTAVRRAPVAAKHSSQQQKAA